MSHNPEIIVIEPQGAGANLPVKLSRERWSSLTSQWPHSWENPVNPDQRVVRKPIEIDGITFLPATYVPEISAGEQSAIRAHEYLYGPTRLLGSA